MDVFNLICGVVTLLAFALALWEMYKRNKSEIAETSKAELELERVRQSKTSVLACAKTINLIVQRSKEESCQLEELRNLARIARDNLFTVTNELSIEEERLSQWEYGKLFLSSALIREDDERLEA